MAERQAIGAVDAPDIRIEVLQAAHRVGGVLGAAGVTDALERVADNTRRVLTPGVVVAVVGAAGSGKTAVVNGALASPLLVVDDRYRTAVPTLVRDRRVPELAVRRRVNGRTITQGVPTVGMPSVTTTLANEANRLDIFRVEVGTPNPVLAAGVTFVDTPPEVLPARGASRASALASVVDALLVAVPADRKISTAEVALVRRVLDRGVKVTVVVTKADSVASVGGAVDGVRSTLASEALDVAVIATSYAWRVLALSRPDDPAIDVASGFPALVDHLDRTVRRPAQLAAASRAVAEARSGIAQAELIASAAMAAGADPAVGDALDRGVAALAELDRADAHWVRSLGERFTALAVGLVGDAGAEIDRVASMSRLPAATARLDETLAAAVRSLGRSVFDARAHAATELAAAVEAATRLPLGLVLSPELAGMATADVWPAGAAWNVEGFRDPVRRFYDLSGAVAAGGATDVERLTAVARVEVARQVEAMAVDAANGAAVAIGRRLAGLRAGLERARAGSVPDRSSSAGADLASDLVDLERRLLGLAGEGVPS